MGCPIAQGYIALPQQGGIICLRSLRCFYSLKSLECAAAYSTYNFRYGDDMTGRTASLCVRRTTHWDPDMGKEVILFELNIFVPRRVLIYSCEMTVRYAIVFAR